MQMNTLIGDFVNQFIGVNAHVSCHCFKASEVAYDFAHYFLFVDRKFHVKKFSYVTASSEMEIF
jgi:hypothetical protein